MIAFMTLTEMFDSFFQKYLIKKLKSFWYYSYFINQNNMAFNITLTAIVEETEADVWDEILCEHYIFNDCMMFKVWLAIGTQLLGEGDLLCN